MPEGAAEEAGGVLPPAPGRALLIRNPIARHRLSNAQVSAMAAIALEAGWRLEHITTERAGDATGLARDAAARGYAAVIVHGGDGTVNEAVNGLADTQTALAVTRGGTANVWAKETRVPKDPVQAMQGIVRGERRRIDLGRANGRYFLLMAGVGLDARIVDNVGVRMKRRLGAASYMMAGAWTLMTTKPWRVRMIADGTPLETPLFWLLAGNTRSYGGVIELTHQAVVTDGRLDVALMRRGNALRLLRDGVLALLHRHERSPNVRYVFARELVIETEGVPVQLDGEACGETPVRISCVPAALTVITRRGLRSPLFGG